MIDSNDAKEILDKVIDDLPDIASLTSSQKERLDFAVNSLAQSMYLYSSLPEGSPEKEELLTKMSYAKLTISSLGALSYVKVEKAIVNALQDVFAIGLKAAIAVI